MAPHHKIIAASTGSQSHLIVAAVLLSFIVWATLQGHLGRYLNDLGIGKKPLNQAAIAAASGGIQGGVTGGGAASALGQAIGNLPLSQLPLPPLPGQGN